MKRPSIPRLPVPTEYAEQSTLVQWWHRIGKHRWSDAELLAIPNGGQRHKAVAAKLVAEGVLAGTPDLYLAATRTVAGSVYRGIWIEMKRREGGRLSPAQIDVHTRLRRAGQIVIVARGWNEASQTIEAYLNGVLEQVAA